ncbi:histidine phosphatase family protein [Blastochloris tepida]|nr:histidine phosphatase family protein [Blastochloris tepida]
MTSPSRTMLYLIRHGETDWNREGRLQGRRDIPLNPTGRRQAAESARRLADVVPPATLASVAFVASPLVRARETMELLRATLGLTPEGYAVDARLAELSFGRWEGLTWPEIRAADPARAAARDRSTWTHTPPGGESYVDLAERLERWCETLSGDAVVVSHGGVTRALLVLFGSMSASEACRFNVPQNRVCVVGEGWAEWR